jgi:hypothetical protein
MAAEIECPGCGQMFVVVIGGDEPPTITMSRLNDGRYLVEATTADGETRFHECPFRGGGGGSHDQEPRSPLPTPPHELEIELDPDAAT